MAIAMLSWINRDSAAGVVTGLRSNDSNAVPGWFCLLGLFFFPVEVPSGHSVLRSFQQP